jgi:hypothetical protein
MDTPETIEDLEEGLPADLIPIAARAAIEGIPVAAIGRILAHPFEVVVNTLKYQLSVGNIVEIPRADWPPTAKLSDRVPTVARRRSDADVDFACRKILKLTSLEAAFLTTLLKVERADKSTLHQVIEAQRFKRQAQPDAREITDPKMVDVMICKLRKKLVDKGFGNVIVTIWGGGYYVEPDRKAALLAHLFPDGDGHGPSPREEQTVY